MGTRRLATRSNEVIMKFFAVASALFVAASAEAQLPIASQFLPTAGLYAAGGYGYAAPYAAAYGAPVTALNAGPLTAGPVAAAPAIAAPVATATYAATAPAVATAPVAATYAAAAPVVAAAPVAAPASSQ